MAAPRPSLKVVKNDDTHRPPAAAEPRSLAVSVWRCFCTARFRTILPSIALTNELSGFLAKHPTLIREVKITLVAEQHDVHAFRNILEHFRLIVNV